MTPSIWKSRKFWLTLADIVVSTATYFIGRYIAPEIGNDVLWLIGTWQPIIILLIVTYTVQNVEAIRNG
jgi:hypothetical protein